MPRFLTTIRTSAYLEELILNAEKEIYIISPYLKISKTFLLRLIDADRKNININIIYGKEELAKDQSTDLKKLSNLSLWFVENLHAKCYLNERDMIITSMNMYEFSEKNNREMGIALNRDQDATLFEEAFREVRSILEHSKKMHPVINSLSNEISSESPVKLTYANWKEFTCDALSTMLKDQVKMIHNKDVVNFRSKNHTLDCFIETNRGKSFFVVSKILTASLYDQLDSFKLPVQLSKDFRFTLENGNKKHYSMAYIENKSEVKSKDLGFVNPSDLAIFHHTILNFAQLMENEIKKQSGQSV